MSTIFSYTASTRFTLLFALHFWKIIWLGSPFSGHFDWKISFQIHHLIYRKPTFTSQYLRWNSFSPQKRKSNLILTLTHWTLAVCFPERLPSKLSKIKFILQPNRYPEHVIKLCMAKMIKEFHALHKFEPERCLIYRRPSYSVRFVPGL